MMELKVDINQPLLEQFQQVLGGTLEANNLSMNTAVGTGKIQQISLPNTLNLYHFSFNLKTSITLNSFNPKDSDYYLLNINLSSNNVQKKVNEQEISIHKHLPTGMLFYPPNTQVVSTTPVGESFEIILIRFHKSMLSTYNLGETTLLNSKENTVMYEDLDVNSEAHLNQAILNSGKQMIVHANILSFLAIFIEKIQGRTVDSGTKMHPSDLKRLFLAASYLRNPTSEQIPSIETLAEIAMMGKTKFKTCFKQVFGLPPIQYHHKIKMEYARVELKQHRKTPSELTYELGYSHPSKFTRAYKKHFNSLPSAL